MIQQEYQKAKKEYFDLLEKQRRELQPVSERYYELQEQFYHDIIRWKTYLPAEKLFDYKGKVKEVCIVTPKGVRDDLFDNYHLDEGIFTAPFGSYVYWEYDVANKYDLYDDEYGGLDDTIEVLGFFDLDLGDGILPETDINYLIHKDLVEHEDTRNYGI